MNEKSKVDVRFDAGLIAQAALGGAARMRGKWEVVCRDKDGNVKWTEQFENIVVTEGLNDLLTATLTGGTRYTTWYVGLKGTGTPAAGDIMTSHATWSELVPYSNANRPTWTPGAVSGGSVSNTASKASFSINSGTTVYGAFLSSDNTKSGTAGHLYAAGDFSSSRAVISGDTLEVTATFTTADDGV